MDWLPNALPKCLLEHPRQSCHLRFSDCCAVASGYGLRCCPHRHRPRDKETAHTAGSFWLIERWWWLKPSSPFPGVTDAKVPENTCDSHSVVSDSLRSHRLKPSRLLCAWNSLRKNTGVGCHSLLQGIFPTQGLNPGLKHCRRILYQLSHQGSPRNSRLWQCLLTAVVNSCVASKPSFPTKLFNAR